MSKPMTLKTKLFFKVIGLNIGYIADLTRYPLSLIENVAV